MASFDLHFRSFEIGDVPAASRVFASCFNLPPWEESWSIEAASRRLEVLLAFPTAVGCVALRERELLGLTIGHSEPFSDGFHFYLNEMCVDPRYQRQGVGGDLIDHLARELRAQRILYIYLLTERCSVAEAFFQRRGFEHDPESTKLWRKA